MVWIGLTDLYATSSFRVAESLCLIETCHACDAYTVSQTCKTYEYGTESEGQGKSLQDLLLPWMTTDDYTDVVVRAKQDARAESVQGCIYSVY